MDHESIKEAFSRAKQDITELRSNLSFLHQEIDYIKQMLTEISQKLDRPMDNQTFQQTNTPQNPSIRHFPSTQACHVQHVPTHNLPLYPLKSQNSYVSTRNEGVPADRQTGQQTNQHTGNEGVQQDNANSEEIQKVSQLLSSLDTIKQEVRVKFKSLTGQEMLVFSTIYQLENEGIEVTYPILASKLFLTQSSVRDYAQRLIKKGIPIRKNKVNNKQILLSVSPELKKIASLTAILQLREI
ncbi:MAG: hypothetical protein Q8Q31_01565 [Nanoarchaeota archaeon]|nr:hypothetical protein [Nanoarchaeota archaeon]